MLRQRGSLVRTFVAGLVWAAVSTTVPVVERHVVDDVILASRSPLGLWLLVLFVLGVVGFAAARTRRFHSSRVMLEVSYGLRGAIHRELQRLDLQAHGQLATGQLVSRANSDISLVLMVLRVLPALTSNLVLMIASLGVMFVFSPLLALISLVILPMLVLGAYRMRTRLYPATWDVQQRTGDVAQVVDQAVTGARVVKGFGQEHREFERLADSASGLYGSSMRAIRMQARYQPLLESIPSFGQVGVLALGGWLALHDRITVGTFLAFASYLVLLVNPARMIARMLSAAPQARAGAERIFELLDTTPAVTDAPGARALPQLRGEISFEGVRFGFWRSEPVLDGFDLRIEPGEVVALVGASGSGKSTAALLLSRFHDPQEGAVRIDGHDVRDVTLASLRSQIGMVFEESFLFSESLRDNIAYGRPDATDAEVEAAARAVEAHEFITRLPDGYDTVVGERGLTLSGGQRQRVALARALLADPRILVLDDATSAVDAKVEESIHATLRRVLHEHTTLLVAHRRSTLRLADRIAVMDAGRVIDDGTHAELMARCPLYRRLLAGEGDDLEADLDPAPPAEAPAVRHPGLGGAFSHDDMIERVAALPPLNDEPKVDIGRESEPAPNFTLWRFLRPYRAPLALGLLLVVLDALTGVAGPYLSRDGIDDGVLTGSQSALFTAAGIFLGVAVVGLVISRTVTLVAGRTGERLMYALRIRVWAQLQRLSVDFYDREMAGRIMTRMTTDVSAFSSLLQDGLISAAASLFTFVGVAVAMAVMSPELTGATALVLIPLLVATVAFRRLSAEPYREARERIAVVNASLQESMAGVRESQAFTQERRRHTEFKRITRGYVDARLAAQRLISLYFPFVDFLADVAAVLVLALGYHMVRVHSLTPGELIAFLLYVNLFFSPIQQLSEVFDDWQQARVSMARISDLMAEPVATPVAAEPVDPGPLNGAIRLEGLRFGYPGIGEEALAGVDLTIEPGETVALVGATGAGKSSLVKLLARFYDPQEGRVLIDGHDLRTLDLDAYRHQLGYVPQETFLFRGTVHDNIAYGRPDASAEEVEAAARAVGAHDLIMRLPGGYEHEIAERGASLSAGQRQLICLARAELVDPAILLLDEATANLDLATEARVTRAMNSVASGRTTVLVAHRLQTARHADRIVVMAQGRVVEDGTHEELLRDRGQYASLWQAA
ncbi:MAG TPA: ABC transporter ATP-binding protein [Actinoallomurus sp.]|nr:ABC transporter ATP-binding protein [Actinoallomurus sp.]